MKHMLFAFVAAFLVSLAMPALAVTSPPSGPTLPDQPKDTSVFKDTDGTCYSRAFSDFGKVVPCPRK